MKPVVLIIGTRPEGIKMIPIYFALKDTGIPVLICSTNQHNDLLQEVFDVFQVKPDIEFNIMKPGQDLFYITQSVLEKTKNFFINNTPSIVLVQGDTTSAMAAALSAFYLHIPVGHIEAGLRTTNIHFPFPEEMNRRFISMISSFHFAPTSLSVGNLLSERIDRSTIFCTGNTIVDALRLMKEKIKHDKVIIDETIKAVFKKAKYEGRQIVLLTAHRRESFNGGIESILHAIKEFAQLHSNVFFFYPFHPNPNVLKAIEKTQLKNNNNLYMCKPIAYKDLVYVLLNADLVVSDSGGICEEAVSLGKQVLILRNETERVEAIWEGIANLVGTDRDNIIKYLKKNLMESSIIEEKKSSIFGDGYAALKIVNIIKNYIENNVAIPIIQNTFIQSLR